MRPRLAAVLAGIFVIGASAFVAGVGGRGDDSADATPKEVTSATATVTTRDLVEREELDGTLS